MIILGIDPGTTRAGYSLIQKDGSRLKLLRGGLLKTNLSSSQAELLHSLSTDLSRLISESHPDCAGLEKLYFTKNQKTALLVAEARGILLATLSRHHLPIFEFTPKEIKKFLTGDGASSKSDIKRTVELILGQSIDALDDILDATAIALLTSNQLNLNGKLSPLPPR